MRTLEYYSGCVFSSYFGTQARTICNCLKICTLKAFRKSLQQISLCLKSRTPTGSSVCACARYKNVDPICCKTTHGRSFFYLTEACCPRSQTGMWLLLACLHATSLTSHRTLKSREDLCSCHTIMLFAATPQGRTAITYIDRSSHCLILSDFPFSDRLDCLDGWPLLVGLTFKLIIRDIPYAVHALDSCVSPVCLPD